MKTNYTQYHITETPALVHVGKIIIKIDDENNIEIEGHNNLNFNCGGDLNINAKKISMMGEDDVIVESKTHLVQMAPRIDLNPHHPAYSHEYSEEHFNDLEKHDHAS